MRDELSRQFLDRAGWRTATRTPLAGDASGRRYERLRLADGAQAVLMDAPPDQGQDVRPFLRIARHLKAIGLSAPEVLAEDVGHGFLLLEDFGDAVFSRVVVAEPSLQNSLYSSAIDTLWHLHRRPAPDGLLPADPAWLGDMVRPVLDWYLPGLTGRTSDRQPELAATIEGLAQRLAVAAPVLMLRDYHAENLIWLPGRRGVRRVGLLDFQDAMAAHPAYDLVSILQDARRDVPQTLQAAMIARYLKASGQSPQDFLAAYALLGAQRNLRILGVFARLSMLYGKPTYVDLIPRVWGHVRRNLDHPELTGLAALIGDLIPEPTPQGLQRIKDQCAKAPTR